MGAWSYCDNWRDYRIELALDDQTEWLEECLQRALARRAERNEMSETRQETMDGWCAHMTYLAKRRFGKSAECVGGTSGNRPDWSIYTNSYKRELGPYSWAEMDEAMQSWNEAQPRPAQADAHEGKPNDSE